MSNEKPQTKKHWIGDVVIKGECMEIAPVKITKAETNVSKPATQTKPESPKK